MTTPDYTEKWEVGTIAPTPDDNGLIDALNSTWETVLSMGDLDGEFWGSYEGLIESQYNEDQGAAAAYDAAAAAEDITTAFTNTDLDNTMLLGGNSTYYEDPWGVCPLRVRMISGAAWHAETTEGFMSMWSIGESWGSNPPERAWFDNLSVISSTTRDYEAHYGTDDAGHSRQELKRIFDRRPRSDYNFVDTYVELIDGYVATIAAEAGNLKAPSLSYKQSPKARVSEVKASRFDTEKFSKSGATATRSTSTVATGESSY